MVLDMLRVRVRVRVRVVEGFNCDSCGLLACSSNPCDGTSAVTEFMVDVAGLKPTCMCSL